MLRVKVCGITNAADAQAAVTLGADAVGFVFAPHSKRRVDPDAVAAIVADLPPLVMAVGVFLDQPLCEVNAILEQCRLDVAQLHGSEDAAYLAGVRRRVIKAVCLVCPADVELLGAFPGEPGFLLDAGSGSGATFDWALAVAARRFGKVVLAGGLTPENVGDAVRTVRPWGVDAATGTEASPGRKDHGKLAAFISNARRAAAERYSP